MSDNNIILIDQLVKHYKGAASPAVDHLSLKIRANEIYGLLGPNGAGKTTTISILCGLLYPTSGNIRIAGMDTDSEMKKIKAIIGVVPQEIALFPSLTPDENLHIIGTIYGIEKKVLKEKIDRALLHFGLEKNRKMPLKHFSGGMKRRLNLIAGILHEPKILFLDEPTVGVDVQSKNLIIDNLQELNRQGTTIIYTSHYLEEAENFCTYITIIDEGKQIISGSPKDLISQCENCASLEDVFLKKTGHKLRD